MRLVGYLKMKFITMYGNMYVKFDNQDYLLNEMKIALYVIRT